MLNFLSLFDSSSQSGKTGIGSSLIPDEKAKQANQPKPSIKFEDLTFIKKISKAKFPVYLVKANSQKKQFALKAYPYKNDQPSLRFENEIRFSHLSHPNVISIIAHKEEQVTKVQNRTATMSYVVMEYAPYGDMFDLVMSSGIEFDEKLVRTYFHQLIEGLEYLHSQGVAHLDIKLENLLVGEDFNLKIADFDLSHFIRDETVTTRGTKNYRAPELLSKTCKEAQPADIYSAGILLFVMKCGGVLPYLEDQSYKGLDLFDLLHNKPDAFWESHSKIQKKSKSFFDSSFKSLFMSMTQIDKKKRPSLSKVKASEWYKGPVYSNKELALFMKETWRLLH